MKKAFANKKLLLFSFLIPFVLATASYHLVYVCDAGIRGGQALDIKYPNVPIKNALKERADEMLKTGDSSFCLNEGHFVFLYYQDQFLFFDTKAGDDPPVYRFYVGSSDPEEIDKHFSGWLERVTSGA